MRDRGIIDTFHIFRLFKVIRIFDKSFGHDAYGVKQSPCPNTLRGWGVGVGSVPGLVPEIYVCFHVA